MNDMCLKKLLSHYFIHIIEESKVIFTRLKKISSTGLINEYMDQKKKKVKPCNLNFHHARKAALFISF